MIILGELDISPLIKAQAFLTQAITEAKTELEKAGAIQAFAFCYELAWKTMKRVLTKRGLEVASPREVFRFSAKEGIIEDPELWFKFIEYRNLTSHTYNLEVADKVFAILPQFNQELEEFIMDLAKLK